MRLAVSLACKSETAERITNEVCNMLLIVSQKEFIV